MVDGGSRMNWELSGSRVTGKIDHFFDVVSRDEASRVIARWRVGGIGSSSGSSA